MTYDCTQSEQAVQCKQPSAETHACHTDAHCDNRCNNLDTANLLSYARSEQFRLIMPV